ncbi:hypothetical protein L2D08_14640 [Domibacillus sp. PGB-M46]|uniref:hypothetical protein n=1 Tax=Domibacillus sp. PGB-M46 TaxID=2910255 RepID=UPI001F56DB6A|nr:hypothetical protein [Domibacillus sp. PGB-M46]MCI2255607.1 hypothetical protein [Domibacillus sp. PGB-M46]
MEPYDELYKMIVIEHGVEADKKFEFDGYYLTVADYIQAVSDRGGYKKVLAVLRMIDHPNIETFVKGAIHKIIQETLAGNKDFVNYYKPIIKKVS